MTCVISTAFRVRLRVPERVHISPHDPSCFVDQDHCRQCLDAHLVCQSAVHASAFVQLQPRPSATGQVLRRGPTSLSRLMPTTVKPFCPYFACSALSCCMSCLHRSHQVAQYCRRTTRTTEAIQIKDLAVDRLGFQLERLPDRFESEFGSSGLFGLLRFGEFRDDPPVRLGRLSSFPANSRPQSELQQGFGRFIGLRILIHELFQVLDPLVLYLGVLVSLAFANRRPYSAASVRNLTYGTSSLLFGSAETSPRASSDARFHWVIRRIEQLRPPCRQIA